MSGGLSDWKTDKGSHKGHGTLMEDCNKKSLQGLLLGPVMFLGCVKMTDR